MNNYYSLIFTHYFVNKYFCLISAPYFMNNYYYLIFTHYFVNNYFCLISAPYFMNNYYYLIFTHYFVNKHFYPKLTIYKQIFLRDSCRNICL